MSELAVHPAAALPEPDRLEYFRLVATIALLDGHSNTEEVEKLHRLADALHLHPAVTEPLFASLLDDQLDARVVPEEAFWFKEPKTVRWHLMIDSIAIAFTDGRLTAGESERLRQLAEQLEIDPTDVERMAKRIEEILFQRDADHMVLARELGAAVGAPDKGAEVIGRMRRITGQNRPV